MSRVYLITGTSKGIGRALSEEIAKRRGTIVYGCSTNPTIKSTDNNFHYPVDVTDPNQVDAFIDTIMFDEKKIDVLINNVGMASMNFSTMMSDEAWKKIIDVNLSSVFYMIRAAVRRMTMAQLPLHIVNTTSIAVPLRLAGEAAYSAAKAAVEQLTRVMSTEFAPLNITVNCIGPSIFPTGLTRSVGEKRMENLQKRLPYPHYLSAADLLHVIDFFTSSKNTGFITGQIVYLGGVG